jgi:hypothetical protein
MHIACWHNSYLLLRMLLALGLLSCFTVSQPLQSSAEAAEKGAVDSLENMLPGINEISGWQRSGAAYAYAPEKLYTYIDGAADQFIVYGFERLQGAEYVSRTDQKESVTVDMYDMGSALGAFGMFTSKKDPASPGLSIGAESFGNDQLVVFYKGRFYVEIQARITAAVNSAVPKTAARIVANKIPGGNARPEILKLFPAAGRVPSSENYMAGGILGHAFLPRGIVCDYLVSGALIKAHIVLFAGPAQAGDAFDEYKKNLARSGETIMLREGFGEKSFAAHEQYQKNIFVALVKDTIVCVTGLSGMQTGGQLVAEICRNIQQSAAPHVPAK